MNFIVTSITEEIDWAKYHKENHGNSKDDCGCSPVGSEDDYEDKPKIIMVDLKPSSGEGYLRIPISVLPNAKVGDRYSINFGQKNIAKA